MTPPPKLLSILKVEENILLQQHMQSLLIEILKNFYFLSLLILYIHILVGVFFCTLYFTFCLSKMSMSQNAAALVCAAAELAGPIMAMFCAVFGD